VQLFGELLTETILYPVPHRHVTLGIPKMLRPYFRYDRDLLKDLCRIPSAKWRELIKRVWEADPLLCPKCHNEMRVVSLIDDRAVIERILRHLGLWEQGVRVLPARAPPEIVDRVIEPWMDDPFQDYDRRS